MHGNELENDEMFIDIYHMNISFLMLCQKMIDADTRRAQYYLGITETQSRQLRSLTLPQLILLARGKDLLCKFQASESMMLDAVIKSS